jgi:hypothetical protein
MKTFEKQTVRGTAMIKWLKWIENRIGNMLSSLNLEKVNYQKKKTGTLLKGSKIISWSRKPTISGPLNYQMGVLW